MSILISSSMKYPEYFPKHKIKLTEGAVKIEKEKKTLMAHLENLRLNKLHKKGLGDVIKNSTAYVGGVKQNKTIKCPEKDHQGQKGKEVRTNDPKEEMSRKRINSSKMSLTHVTTSMEKDGPISPKNESQNNFFTNPLKQVPLDVILEQDTQRTINLHSTAFKNTNSDLNFKLTPITKDSSAYSNPQFNCDYLNDIYHNLLIEEENIPCFYGYMTKQEDINEKMRSILIDWVIDVHYKFKLGTETLFLCVFLIDRYLNEKVILRGKLQLLAVSSLMIACKYEEIYSPEIYDFVYITENTYDKKELLELEVEILTLFKYNITVPSSFQFYEILSTLLGLTKHEIALGRFLLELFLLDYRCTKYKASEIANTVCFLVLNHRKAQCENYSDEKRLKECAKDICFILENLDNIQLHSVRKKFSTDELYFVGRIRNILN